MKWGDRIKRKQMLTRFCITQLSGTKQRMYIPALYIVLGPTLIGCTRYHQSPPSIVVCHVTEDSPCLC